MNIRFAFLLVFIVFGFAGTFLILGRPASLPLTEREGGSSLRICTANIHYNNTDSRSVTERLLKTESDIYVINEWRGDNLDLDLFVKNGYKAVVNHPREGVHGISIIARKAFQSSGEVFQSPIEGPCRIPLASARFRFEGNNISLLGIHVPPPISGCENTTNPTIKAIADWVDGGRLKNAVGEAVSGQPVILAGDFNAFPFNSEIRGLLRAGFVDSYSAAKTRYGPTWAPFSWMPSLIRIDYIFVPQEFSVDASYTIDIRGSDHRAVISDIRLNNR